MEPAFDEAGGQLELAIAAIGYRGEVGCADHDERRVASEPLS